MGANVSKPEDNSSLEDTKSGAEGVKQEPQQPLHQGPIHCLCSVGEDCIASGGVDKVR